VETKNRRFVEDLPAISISRLRAEGAVTPEMAATPIRLGDVEMIVGVVHFRFPDGGGWSFFNAPCCARRARVLRLLDGSVVCRACCIRCGVGYRTWPMGVKQRAELRIPKLRAMLESEQPLRLKSSLRWGKMGRRKQHMAALRKAELLVGHTDFVKLKPGESDVSSDEGS
jgi:hypothetical protein